MTDTATLFRTAWDHHVADRMERSPSFRPEEYTATGRASAEYGGKRNAQWWLDHGPDMVDRWVAWREQHPWPWWEVDGGPAIELKLEFVLPGDIAVRAFIDRVAILPSGEGAVVDIKTGREPETAEQLGLYRVGLWKVHGLPVDWGYFWDANKGSHGQPQDLTMYTEDYFAEKYENAIRGINAGSFLAKPQNNCKNWCGVARACPAFGGTLDNTRGER